MSHNEHLSTVMAGAGTEQVVKGKIDDLVSPKGIDNVDWMALREEWITTGISLTELARKYDIKYFTLRSYYYRHQWAYHLAQFRDQMHDSVKTIRQAKVEELSARLAKVDERVVGLCETVLEAIEQNVDATLEYREKPGGAENVLDIKDAVTTLKAAVDTIQKIHASARLAGGGVTGRINLDLLPNLSDEEKERLNDEFGYLRAKPASKVIIPDFVASDKPPQDAQGTEDNLQTEILP